MVLLTFTPAGRGITDTEYCMISVYGGVSLERVSIASLINRYGYLSVRGQFAIGRIPAVTTLMHGECSKYIKFTAWL